MMAYVYQLERKLDILKSQIEILWEYGADLGLKDKTGEEGRMGISKSLLAGIWRWQGMHLLVSSISPKGRWQSFRICY